MLNSCVSGKWSACPPSQTHDDLLADGRIHQDGRGHVGDRADGQHVERPVDRVFLRLLHGKAGGGGVDRGLFVRQVGARALVDAGAQLLAPGQAQDVQDFLVAFDHAVLGRVRVLIEEGRGGQADGGRLVLRVDQVGDSELVVDFVVGVGVQNHVHVTRRSLQIANELFLSHAVKLLFMNVCAISGRARGGSAPRPPCPSTAR